MYAYLSAHPWSVAPLNASEPAMDMFLVLTGFLAALSLVPALEASPSPCAVVARRAVEPESRCCLTPPFALFILALDEHERCGLAILCMKQESMH